MRKWKRTKNKIKKYGKKKKWKERTRKIVKKWGKSEK